MPVVDVCRKAGISQATYFNWKKKYAGLLPTKMAAEGTRMRVSTAATPGGNRTRPYIVD
jgi:hypothetical protein